MLADITSCTLSYLSSFTEIWAYVFTCAFAYRTRSSIVTDLSLSISTLCFLSTVSSRITQLVSSTTVTSVPTAVRYRSTWETNSCEQPASTHQPNTFQTSLASRCACSPTFTPTHKKYIIFHGYALVCSISMQKNCISRTQRFCLVPRKTSPSTPGTAFVHENKATSV